jgi:hypothetical protein
MPETPQMADQAIEALYALMQSSESDPTRVQAAKILLDRLTPKKDDAAQKNEVEERDAALAEARGLLAEFAATKLAFFRLQNAMAKASEAGSGNA